MKTASEREAAANNAWTGPLYLDAGALAKLYLKETGSDGLDAALRGRSDLIISDLIITEIVYAVARCRREGILPTRTCNRLYRQMLADVESGFFVKTDLMSDTHREAERLLLAVDNVALRAADSLHLAQASLAGAASIVTYDRTLAEAALKIGLNPLP